MFSIDDANADDDPINLDLTNYSEIGHTHEITDVNDLEELLERIESIIELSQSDSYKGGPREQ